MTCGDLPSPWTSGYHLSATSSENPYIVLLTVESHFVIPLLNCLIFWRFSGLSLTENDRIFQSVTMWKQPSQVEFVIKTPLANAGDTRNVCSILGSERSPGVGNGNLLQYSYLENPMDRGAWRDSVQGVAKESGTTEVSENAACETVLWDSNGVWTTYVLRHILIAPYKDSWN